MIIIINYQTKDYEKITFMKIIDNIKLIQIPKYQDYLGMFAIMEDKLSNVINCSQQETIYFLEHQDCYTAGTNSKITELINPGNIPVYDIGRGGKYTYHGPGQRIIYPILDINKRFKQDLRFYIASLETWAIAALKILGITAYQIPNNIGVWVNHKDQEYKIAAIGIRVRKWISYHGMSINIATDLNKYEGIIPCGIANVRNININSIIPDIKAKDLDKALIDTIPILLNTKPQSLIN